MRTWTPPDWALAGIRVSAIAQQMQNLISTNVPLIPVQIPFFDAVYGQQVASTSESATLFASAPLAPNHRIHPPNWLGWSLISVGSVLILYSLALKKPGG